MISHYPHMLKHIASAGMVFRISILCSVLTCVLTLRLFAQATQPMQSNAIPMPVISYDAPPATGIQLIPGSSTEFDRALRLLADADSISALQAIMPYSVVVRNNTAERLIAIVVRFYLTDPNGETVRHQMTVGTRSNEPSSMINPGDMVLITPETGLNTIVRRGVFRRISQTSILKGRLAKHADLYSRQNQIRIVVDAVVFDDGGVIGPDKGRTLEKLNAWAAAEEAIIENALARHGAELDAYLGSVRNAAVPRSASLDDVDHFAAHQQEFAEALLSQRQAFKSEADFFEYLQTRRLLRIPTLKRRQK